MINSTRSLPFLLAPVFLFTGCFLNSSIKKLDSDSQSTGTGIFSISKEISIKEGQSAKVSVTVKNTSGSVARLKALSKDNTAVAGQNYNRIEIEKDVATGEQVLEFDVSTLEAGLAANSSKEFKIDWSTDKGPLSDSTTIKVLSSTEFEMFKTIEPYSTSGPEFAGNYGKPRGVKMGGFQYYFTASTSGTYYFFGKWI